MAWIEVERDDRFKVRFVTYRCWSCKRLAITTGHGQPSPCCCGAR